VPFYRGLSTTPHWDAILDCLPHIGADGVSAVIAFWAVSAVEGSRRWIVRPTPRSVGVFTIIGLLVTVAVEWHAVYVAGRWAYASAMPIVPVVGVGLLPVLQPTALLPAVVWFVGRQLRESPTDRSARDSERPAPLADRDIASWRRKSDANQTTGPSGNKHEPC